MQGVSVGRIAFFILLVILLLASCRNKPKIITTTTNETVKEITQPILEEENIGKVKGEESAPLIIGDKQYRGQLGERVEVEKGSWRIPSDPVDCTVKDIDKLFIMTLWVDPKDPNRRSSIENLELLHNLKELHIRGENFDRVDFSPISSLLNLEEIEIEGNITHLPDLTSLKQLKKIRIKKAALESIEGIRAPHVKKIEIETINGSIDSISPLNNLLMLEDLYITCLSDKIMKLSGMTNLPKLKSFEFQGYEIDMRGIDHLASLEYLTICDCKPFNLEGIGRLNNLKTLIIDLISDNPSIDFLRNMPNITILQISGHYQRYSWDEIEAFQVLDVSSLGTIKTLESLYFINLIIKNVSALDAIDRLDPLRFDKSRLYDENDKTRHRIMYEIIH
jgi:hypothetical protein